MKKRAQTWCAAHSEKMKDLGKRRLACRPGRRKPRRLCYRPPMMDIAAVEQRHDEPGINEGVSGHSQ